jgi:hypothetical protein
MSKKPQDYKQLRELWYAKLRDDGFSDIEADDDRLKKWSSSAHLQHTVEEWQAKEAYYNAACSFLLDHTFETELDHVIWEYYANGMSARNITHVLNDTKVTKTNRTTVAAKIKALDKIMREKYFSWGRDEH